MINSIQLRRLHARAEGNNDVASTQEAKPEKTLPLSETTVQCFPLSLWPVVLVIILVGGGNDKITGFVEEL